jgi:LmbE family N-acetylglucosaminyl deacetylase
MLRLLCITAHPDDEAGPFGGSLALYRRRGVETHVVCLTAGEAGSYRGDARSDGELAELRRAEFLASCEILEVSHAQVLDYPDGGLDRVDFFQVAGRLVQVLRHVRPQVVLSLGPEGGITGHGDHSMVSLLATAAFHWAGRSDRYPEQLGGDFSPHSAQKLYYATASFALPDRPPVSPSPITTAISIADFVERKLDAFRAHKSQMPLFAHFERTIRNRGDREFFHLAAGAAAGDLLPEDDLFSGIADDLS